jgi:hypothetical protein
MNKTDRNFLWISATIFVLLAGCAHPTNQPVVTEEVQPSQTASPVVTSTQQLPTQSPTPQLPAEQPVTEIALSGPLADPAAEVSGLAWFGDYLIILPQYPERFSDSAGGFIYALAKTDILAYLDGQSNQPLEPKAISFEAPRMKDRIRRYQGYEAIAFSGNNVYLLIEAGRKDEMMGYLVSGQMSPDMSKLSIDTDKIVPIQPQTKLKNKADEAMVIWNDQILTFYEINGADLNPQPVTHIFNLDLQPQGTLPMPSLEYGLTDAALESDGNRFWVINDFFINDIELLPAHDPLADRFGKGPTHTQFQIVERLVEMQYSSSGITLTDTAPIQLQLDSIVGRNWEGLALLDQRGFLLMTDKFPETILGFVPLP